MEEIEELAKNPVEKSNVKKSHNHPLAVYRLRVGNYRVLFDREDRLRIIEIIDVGHRKEVYE
ncbi:MAG: type II toxin-antitoxin system RelE/ParE family toxin [Sphingobacteriaceae bacterium]|nr:type II toxin-antitoxin system RelE/ParE family toxin [Cytophagaceae bacterium]